MERPNMSLDDYMIYYEKKRKSIEKDAADVKARVQGNMYNKNYLQFPVPPPFDGDVESVHNSFRKKTRVGFVKDQISREMDDMHNLLEKEVARRKQDNQKLVASFAQVTADRTSGNIAAAKTALKKDIAEHRQANLNFIEKIKKEMR